MAKGVNVGVEFLQHNSSWTDLTSETKLKKM